MTYSNDCTTACEPKRIGCVEAVANDLENTSHRLSALVGELASRLSPVLGHPHPACEENCKPPAYAAPLASGLQSVDARLSGVEIGLRDLLARLEV